MKFVLTKTTLLSFDDKNVTLRPVLDKRSQDDLVVGSRLNCNNPVVSGGFLVYTHLVVLILTGFAVS